MTDIAGNVTAVRQRIERAAERARRNPADITLIAAAKSKSATLIDEAIAAGVADIGENYVQEAAAKRPEVSRPARWHMIGHLQRNKAARALSLFDLIHTVDSVALGETLSRHAAETRHVVGVLVEVNLGGERSKSGIAPGAVGGLVERLRSLPYVAVEGLMVIPPPADPEAARPFFRRARDLCDELGLAELSMGMSEDFEIAIEEGATMVRIGRAIFGERKRR